jgi:hypothetical protein
LALVADEFSLVGGIICIAGAQVPPVILMSDTDADNDVCSNFAASYF